MRDYMDALLAELDTWSFYLHGEDRCLDSIYLGGGTPSTLRGTEVSRLLSDVMARFELAEGVEVTVEVNPGTWAAGDFAAACSGGVDRISLGLQSLHDPFLRLLGRAHDAASAVEAVQNARRGGAASISVDLIYGLPGMNTKILLDSLEGALATGPQHVSLYALSLSEGSPLFRTLRKGRQELPAEEEVADEYLAACEVLDGAGFEHYEISNFCLPGHHSRHNLGYWIREECLGVGAGAHSLLGGCRFSNPPSLLAYMRAVLEGRMVREGWELLDPSGEREEEIMLGLRTSLGVPVSSLEVKEERLEVLEGLGLLRRAGGRVRLTRNGMLVSNAVIADLLPA
jgi:putative oxygen-independent coproporphyrinogen III oxidase